MAALRHGILGRWRRYWVPRSGPAGFGRFAARMAAYGTAPYHGRSFLCRVHPKGFISHTATLNHPNVRLGAHSYIGDNVVAWSGPDAGEIALGDGVELY